MAQHQISNKLIFYGVPTKILVNTETGQAEVFADEGIFGDTKIAEVGANNEWVVTNKAALTKKYNNANGKNASESDVEKYFITQNQGVKQYNNERASIINKNSPFNTKTYLSTKVNPVPGIVNPTSGVQSNQTEPTVAPTPPATNSDGNKPQSPSGIEEPNTQPTEPGLTQTDAFTDVTPDGVAASFSPSKQYLSYPLSIPPGIPYDFIRISAYKYVAGGLQFGEGRTNIEDRFTNLISTVTLPMQPNLSESNSVDWGGDNLDPIRAALAGLSIGAMTSAQTMSLQPIAEAAKEGGERFANLLNDPNTMGSIKAYFAGQAVGSNIQARATGAVINPNMELLFSGPRMRTFNFDFRLTPRGRDEAEEIKKIVRSFKMNSAVQRSKSHAFLLTPNIFKLEYIYNGSGQHPFLNKFKPCALTNFSVNYTPDGSYMTYRDGGSLTSYNISMSFSELEPIYQDDYAKDYNSHTSMGY